MQQVGTKLRICVLGKPPTFVQEVAGLLEQTRYADALHEPEDESFSMECLIVDGGHVTFEELSSFVTTASRGQTNPLVVIIGGCDQSHYQHPDRIWLPRPLAPEVLEWTLDRFSHSAWTRSGRVERRAHSRYQCRATIEPSITLLDVSEGGAQLETDRHIGPGHMQPVPLHSVFPSLVEPLSLRVIACRPADKAGTYRVHGCFWRLTDRMRLALVEALDASGT